MIKSIETIQIVTCEGIQNSTLDETYIQVFKRHAEIPYICRRYKVTPARIKRIRALNHIGNQESRMEVCVWRYENYTDHIKKEYEH